MSWYQERVLARLINVACGVKPARKQREKIVPRARGDVLEIGFGSGLNLEHGKAPSAKVHKSQDRLNPGWKRVSGGCKMNRDIPALIEDDKRMHIPGVPALSYNYRGAARIR